MIKLVKIGDEYASSNYKEFIIDSADDVSSLPTDCAAGSIAVCSDGIKYVLCPSGDWDVMSVGGASSDITSQDIVSALGYTPVKASDVPDAYDDTQIKEDLAAKMTEPSGAAVGQYFRVASIDENGHAVLEACDLPVAGYGSGGKLGMVKTGDGLINNNGSVSVSFAGPSTIANRSAAYVIQAGRLVESVDSVLCSTATSEALTTTQQAAARARLGAAGGKFELIETFTASGNRVYKNTTPSGNAYNFTEIHIVVDAPAGSAEGKLVGFYNTESTNYNYYLCEVFNAINTARRISYINAKIDGDLVLKEFCSQSNATTTSYKCTFTDTKASITAFTSILLSATVSFPENTTIKIYGKWA